MLMLVRELIASLSELPPDVEVWFNSEKNNTAGEIGKVRFLADATVEFYAGPATPIVLLEEANEA